MKIKTSLKSFIQSTPGIEPLMTEWKTVTQEDVDKFAAATGDFQWLHTDPSRCAKESPFGAPIAHGMLTLATVAGSFFEIFDTSEYRSVINYGCEKVRFPAALPVGHRYRVKISSQETRTEQHYCDFVFKAEVEKENSDKPACVATIIFRLMN